MISLLKIVKGILPNINKIFKQTNFFYHLKHKINIHDELSEYIERKKIINKNIKEKYLKISHFLKCSYYNKPTTEENKVTVNVRKP